jgi:hypothetical protein
MAGAAAGRGLEQPQLSLSQGAVTATLPGAAPAAAPTPLGRLDDFMPLVMLEGF